MKNRIRELRKNHGITQSQLAKMVGLSSVQIGYLERGLRRLSDVWIDIFSKAFHVQPWELFESNLIHFDRDTLHQSFGMTLDFFKNKKIEVETNVSMFSNMMEDLYLYILRHQNLKKEPLIHDNNVVNDDIKSELNSLFQKQKFG